MDAKQEVTESLKRINRIHQELEDMRSLEEKLDTLEKKIDRFIELMQNSPEAQTRLELVAHLCLLSELAASDFDRMIVARERFQDILPDHFVHYLSYLEQATWAISWSGCLDCRHFSSRCNLNLSPQEDPNDKYRLQKTCHAYVKRSAKI